MKYQQVGLHVSAAGGVENAPGRARSLKAECFQFFSRSPRGGGAPTISSEQANDFRARCKRYELESYIHTPYYINFASKKKSLAAAAPHIVREELKRGSQLGVKYVVTHLGSARDWEIPPSQLFTNEVLKQVAVGLKEIYKGNEKYSTELLLEIAAGAGAIIGHTFDELQYVLKELGRRDVHICLDTCHMFASGYDMRDAVTLNDTMRQFRNIVGLSQLKLVHVNDSKAGWGERKDWHEHIGKGKIGSQGFRALLAHKDFQKVNFILETKHDKGVHDDLRFLKQWRR